MGNLTLWNKVRAVPADAQKKITGGRLNGFTDINPVWRIKTLTEQFGQCGIGWYYDIVDRWTETGANNEIASFVSVNLFVNDPASGWSKPIAGTGGSMLVSKEKNGLYTSDECFKMALTDALSVACKALGIGADVYWSKDANKYEKPPETATKVAPTAQTSQQDVLTPEQRNNIGKACKEAEVSPEMLRDILDNLGHKGKKLAEISAKEYNKIIDQITGTGLPFEV